ncbi:hypothetical protein D3C73_378520 [compost metagenome]
MSRIRSRLNQIQQRIEQREQEQLGEICNRIIRLQYDPDEALLQFPINRQAARQRFMIWLEYEEINAEYPFDYITEGQYACHMYPEIVLAYVHYLLEEVGVPPMKEIDLLREHILAAHPDLTMDFYRLEMKWRQLSEPKT